MNMKDIAHLLKERVAYMRKRCPAYNLDYVVRELLRQRLSTWDEEVGGARSSDTRTAF